MLASSPVIAFVPTINPARARAFYEDVLRLPFREDDGFALVFDLHGAMLRVVKLQELQPQQFTILGWTVDDIATEIENLRSHGVTFENFGLPDQNEHGVWTAPGGAKIAWFKDPDGNTLSVTQFAA